MNGKNYLLKRVVAVGVFNPLGLKTSLQALLEIRLFSLPPRR